MAFFLRAPKTNGPFFAKPAVLFVACPPVPVFTSLSIELAMLMFVLLRVRLTAVFDELVELVVAAPAMKDDEVSASVIIDFLSASKSLRSPYSTMIFFLPSIEPYYNHINKD
jgi:hypothetical protein